jgi:hypothetical protein
MMEILKHRKPLINTKNQITTGELILGFIGGSITDARARHNWPEPVIAWFVEQFPDVRIFVENAAIGATGSELAVLRAKRDLIDRGCDLVFIDYAVNDFHESPDKRMRTREGLLRKLMASDRRDIVLVYTFSQLMYNDMIEEKMPPTIAEFEKLAEHYGIGSVWMGLYALDEVRKGRMRWEEWLPDGLHPTSRGSLSYGHSVIAYLEKELFSFTSEMELSSDDTKIPEPLHPLNWENATILPFSEVKLDGPWTIRRYPFLEWIDQAIESSAVGARLSFSFEGRGLTLGTDFGLSSCEFRYRLDHGEWLTSERDRPVWLKENSWYHMFFISDDLAQGSHHFELELIHGNRESCTGTNCRLGVIGIIQ